jgi:hypothetical protein
MKYVVCSLSLLGVSKKQTVISRNILGTHICYEGEDTLRTEWKNLTCSVGLIASVVYMGSSGVEMA